MYHPIIEFIRNDLEEKKISRLAFAEMCGYSLSNINNWLTGIHTPKLTVAEDMLNALGYDLIVKKKEETDV